jgi:toxin ParE1/3/4
MTIRKRASAKRDLIEHYIHLTEHVGEEGAERFLRCVEESFSDLALHPAVGAPLSPIPTVRGFA